ncbi:hypothetical protein [Brucella pseudogrignonensis]|uniref:Uncharacterized protein n=1 Tax=Brucella pseudogrignonensis TaxID=419475 RepID=A0A256G649_9HYPH|nr:hypothetical protein [Brucella pseudogrignonensis]OYR22583.1 hypothetical protein CEV34_4415 [Brucella pseudogrignonensis]
MTPIYVQELAQTIVQTATTILDEVKAQLEPVAAISSIATVL